MNQGLSKCLDVNAGAESCSGTNSKTARKSRRRRKRNKLKGAVPVKFKKKLQKIPCRSVFNPSLMNEHLKLIHTNEDHFGGASSTGKKRTMSSWFWTNYNTALEWRNKHKVAYWKSYALSLENENKYLMEIIRNSDPSRAADFSTAGQDLLKPCDNELSKDSDKGKKSTCTTSLIHGNEMDDQHNADSPDGDNEQFAFELSEEMLKYFEESFKHKMDLKLSKEQKEESEVMEEKNAVQEAQKARQQRAKEMELLYGEGASMIVGMETAVQLSYDRHCDMKSPKYWPNLPFKL